MITNIKYTKANGEVSNRVIHPFGVLDAGRDNVKIQAIDLSGYTDSERQEFEIVLDAIRKEYIQKIYALGLGANIRSFFFSGLEY